MNGHRRPQLLERDEGIILRTFPYGEGDLILRAFTKSHGKLSLIAKGARTSGRKNQSQRPEPLDRGVLEYTERKGSGALLSLRGITTERSLRKLREDLDRLALGSLVCDATDLLFREESVEAPETYELISLTLQSINDATTPSEMLRASHLGLTTLLSQTGHLDPAAAPPASVHGMRQVLNQIERVAERGLTSRVAVEETLRQFSLAAQRI